jgi:hypothetical protein
VVLQASAGERADRGLPIDRRQGSALRRDLAKSATKEWQACETGEPADPPPIPHARERRGLDVASDARLPARGRTWPELRRVGSGKRLTFCDGEKRLSEWLVENAFVTWEVTPAPWLLEEALIAAVPLPLNLDQNASNAFCSTLAGIRRAAPDTARALPVWNG